MLLLENSYRFTPDDTAKDIPFSFEAPVGTDRVELLLRFDPACETEEALCCEPIKRAIGEYYAGNAAAFTEDSWLDYLPLKNLITISLDHNGTYLGNAHRWDNRQAHVFHADHAPRGFLNPDTLCGSWSGMLHIHEIVSLCCSVKLAVYTEASNGMAAL